MRRLRIRYRDTAERLFFGGVYLPFTRTQGERFSLFEIREALARKTASGG